jgi:hypothetical protein
MIAREAPMRKNSLVMMLVALPGCMTMTSSRSQTIDVQTSPPGARVTIRPTGNGLVSPANVSLHRKPDTTVNAPEAGTASASYVVTASLAGYRDASVPIQSEVAGGTFRRNLIWLHPALYGIAVAVDMSTGAGYELTPSSVFLKLEPDVDREFK